VIDFQRVKVIEDSHLFIGKEVVQFFDQKHPFKACALLFTEDFFYRDSFDQQFLSNCELFNIINFQNRTNLIKTTSALKGIWALMEEELKKPEDIYQPYLLSNLLHNFLFTTERTNVQRKPGSISPSGRVDTLLKFKALIEKNYKKQEPVTYYANQLHVSSKVLAKTTQETVGRTPKQMLDDRIILEAKRLLVNSADAGKNIAFELGFKEPTNFNKYFRRHEGITPADFRMRYTQG